MKRLILLVLVGFQVESWGQNLVGQVFILTDNFDVETCELGSGCDCCSTDLFFLTDKEFGLVVRCIYNDSYYRGTYAINKDKLVLTFKPKEVNEIVDEATFKVSHEVNKTTSDPVEFKILKCDNKLKLENTTNPGFKNGIRLPLTTEKEKTKRLKDREAWKLLSE